jgi:hypothetical protein
MVSPTKLQLIYLSTSLFSTYCVVSNTYLPTCANLVGIMCLCDMWFVKKKDMMLHHILVLFLAHYMNTHYSNPYRFKIMSALLSTEISTIFLTLHNMLENTASCSSIVRIKQLNKLAFVSTFVYYRLYNYSYSLLNAEVRNSYLIYSAGPFERWEVCSGIYGLFLLNVYWVALIAKKAVSDQTCKKSR